MPTQGVPQVTRPTLPNPPSQAQGGGPARGRVPGSGAGLLWQLGGIQGQGVVQELILLRGLDHAPPAGRGAQAVNGGPEGRA